MENLKRKYYYGKKESFPEEVEPGAILYAYDENGLYIDKMNGRVRINPQVDWNDNDDKSISAILNKPTFEELNMCNVTDSINQSNDIPTSKTIKEAISDIKSVAGSMIINTKGKKYGITGIGQEASQLTRILDSIGMRAEVGTDGDNSSVVNDFDYAYPFMRRKCVGNWTVENGHAKFNVQAYLGDDDYAEDGSKGDYVAVECPLCYYSLDQEQGTLIISGIKWEGFRAFDIFCRNHDQNDLIEKYYAPAYFIGVKDDHAVSLPDIEEEQGNYYKLVNCAKTYNNASSVYGMIVPVAWLFYEYALFTVEFAQQNCQSVMKGCCNLKSTDGEECKFIDSTHVVASYHYSRVVGSYLAIGEQRSRTYVGYKASHRIISVSRCNEDGSINQNGSYNLLEVEDLGKGYVEYTLNTSYYIASRGYPTGACNTVSTPSGSPVNNTDGFYPCKYRWVENPYGNHYRTSGDLFGLRRGSSDNDYYLEWYYLLKPWEYIPSNDNKPDETDLKSEMFVKLGVETPHSRYVNGYLQSREYDIEYPDIWIPGLTTASSSTYFADYAYVNSSNVVRTCRFGGFCYDTSGTGFSLLHALTTPSSNYAFWSASLFFAQ